MTVPPSKTVETTLVFSTRGPSIYPYPYPGSVSVAWFASVPLFTTIASNTALRRQRSFLLRRFREVDAVGTKRISVRNTATCT